MHYSIRILTQGANKDEARATAFDYADALVDLGEFDYYDAEDVKTYRLASELGKKAVEGALARNREEFMLSLQAVRLMLQEFTDEQIYQDDYPPEKRDYYASRWQFSQVGEGRSYLYGDRAIWGEAIRNDKDFQAATEGHANLWVTSMDFHN